jgi:hypothetical protein
MENREGDCIRNSSWATELQEEIRDSGDFGCECDGAVGECGKGTPTGSQGHGERFDDVDVEFVRGVTDVCAAPGNGRRSVCDGRAQTRRRSGGEREGCWGGC